MRAEKAILLKKHMRQSRNEKVQGILKSSTMQKT